MYYDRITVEFLTYNVRRNNSHEDRKKYYSKYQVPARYCKKKNRCKMLKCPRPLRAALYLVDTFAKWVLILFIYGKPSQRQTELRFYDNILFYCRLSIHLCLKIYSFLLRLIGCRLPLLLRYYILRPAVTTTSTTAFWFWNANRTRNKVLSRESHLQCLIWGGWFTPVCWHTVRHAPGRVAVLPDWPLTMRQTCSCI